ncbi:hypothetical protein SALBM135S_05373 [Streptomyces alboniger]
MSRWALNQACAAASAATASTLSRPISTVTVARGSGTAAVSVLRPGADTRMPPPGRGSAATSAMRG